MSEAKDVRLFSLDFLRGADMLLLTVFGALMRAVSEGYGPFPSLVDQTRHPWEGFTLWDMILPLFVFMSGAAIPFGFGKRLDGRGLPTKAFWTHLLKRGAMLWALGVFVQGNLMSLSWPKIHPYGNVLQTIAVLMTVTSLWMLIRQGWMKALLPVLAIVGWGLYGHFAVGYEKAPEGFGRYLLSALFIGCTFGPAGCFSTQVLRSGRSAAKKLAFLFGLGLVLAALGWALLGVVPSIKRLMTLSYSLRALGYSFLLMGGAYGLTDVLKFRRGLWIFTLYGQASLAAYVIDFVFRGPVRAAGEILTAGLPQYLGPGSGPVTVWFGAALVQTYLICKWRQLRNGETGR